MTATVDFSFHEMWERIMACDPKYDGLFYTAVKTTKIYCRPSCRSRKPKKVNVEFCATIEEAERKGYRACKRCRPEVEHSPNVSLVQDVAAYLAANYQKPLSLQDISLYIGISPAYLDRLFKQETMETPRSYLEKIRIDKAAYLLKSSDRQNLDICFDSGFQSPSNFYKSFRRQHQMTPSEYRKKVRTETV